MTVYRESFLSDKINFTLPAIINYLGKGSTAGILLGMAEYRHVCFQVVSLTCYSIVFRLIKILFVRISEMSVAKETHTRVFYLTKFNEVRTMVMVRMDTAIVEPILLSAAI
jgi:hypothetical protein